MFYDHDVAVVDNDLSGEKYGGLQALAEGYGNLRSRIGGCVELWSGVEISEGDGRCIGGDYTIYAGPDQDEN